MRWIVLALVGALAACGGTGSTDPAVVAADANVTTSPPPSASVPKAPPPPAAEADACVASASDALQDLDPEDSPETPWHRDAGKKVTVYFENAGADARYVELLGRATAIWSKSPCIHAQTVAKCPASSSCVRLKQATVSPDGADTDGEFEGIDERGVRTGGTVTVYTKLMDKETDNGALATIVHELGHAFGLVHRKNKSDVMNADTEDDTNPMPDAVDFHNLLVIYGAK